MKARTKEEKEVEVLSKRLRPLTARQIAEAYDKCYSDGIWRSKKKHCFCTHCGESFEYEGKGPTACPECGTVSYVSETQKYTNTITDYFVIITVCGDYQVLRFFELEKRFNIRKREFRIEMTETIRHWIDRFGKVTIQTRKYNCAYWNVYFNKDSEFEIRKPCFSTDFKDISIYSRMRIRDDVRRNGFDGDFHGFYISYTIESLLTRPMFETLWKAGRQKLLSEARGGEIFNLWNSIKITLRNNYVPEDWRLWIDTVQMLEKLGMDTKNPVYVCPKDLEKVHDMAVRKIRAKNRKERMEAVKKQFSKIDMKLKRKACYFDISLYGKNLNITTLKSAKDYFDEGEHMHNCVFDNEYYNKRYSLILSAKDYEGHRLATVELSLKSFKVIQCRAVQNKQSEYEDEIIQLISDNVTKYRNAKRNVS